MLPYQYAYLFADLVIGLPIWIFFYILRKDLHHKMWVFSVIGAVVGPISEAWYIKDYWRPLTVTGWPVSIEDVLFGFLVGGVGCVMYEELFGKRIAKRHTRSHHWIFLLFPGILLFFIFFNKLLPTHYINSIYISAIAFILTAVVIIWRRKDLLTDAIVSALLGGGIFFFGYLFLLYFFPDLFTKMWLLKNISGITLYKIPVEELMWAFGYGMMVGPIYEFYAGLRFQQVEMKVTPRRKKRK